MRPIEIFQGENDAFSVESNIDLTNATEIDFRIDTTPQIVKTLTGGGVTSVTSTGFNVQLDAGDTSSVKAGNYKYQCRATIATKVYTGRFTPNKVIIRDSIHQTEGMGNDYS